MKQLIFILSLSFLGQTLFCQHNRTFSEAQQLKNRINQLPGLAVYEYTPSICDATGKLIKQNISYRFYYDSSEKKLLKVVETDSLHTEEQAYYYSDDQLFNISTKSKSNSSSWLFDTVAYSVGSTEKNENDPYFIEREKQLSKAYKFLMMHKRVIGSKAQNPKLVEAANTERTVPMPLRYKPS
jgi:hypothetical protein